VSARGEGRVSDESLAPGAIAAILRTPSSRDTLLLAASDSNEPRVLAARFRLARDLDRVEVQDTLAAWLARGVAHEVLAAALVLAASEQPSDAPLLAGLARHLSHGSDEAAFAVALAFDLRAGRGHPLGPALAEVVRAQRRPVLESVTAFALSASKRRGLVEPSLEAAIPALLETITIRWESAQWLEDALDRGLYRPTREDLEGAPGRLLFDTSRERASFGGKVWARALADRTVEVEWLHARLAKQAKSGGAGEASQTVNALRNLASAEVDVSPFVDVLEGLLRHPARAPQVAARTLLDRLRQRPPKLRTVAAAPKDGQAETPASRTTSAQVPPPSDPAPLDDGPLALVGRGELRGKRVPSFPLRAHLLAHPESLEACLPQLAYALHGEPRADVLTALRQAVTALQARGRARAEVLERLVPLVFGVLLDRDYGAPFVDRGATETLAVLFEAGARPLGLLPLLCRRLDDPHDASAAMALYAGAAREPVISASLEARLERGLSLTLAIDAHPGTSETAFRRAHALAGVLAITQTRRG